MLNKKNQTIVKTVSYILLNNCHILCIPIYLDGDFSI